MSVRRPAGLPSLSERLACIVELAGESDRLFDVGCDHALIPITLAMLNRCRDAYACDSRAGPLAVAADRIARYGVADRVMPVLADGLDGMSPGERDTVVIAGLGGNETIRILRRAAPIPAGVVFILQPMKSAAALRLYLDLHGFRIEREALCRDGRSVHCVLRVRRTGDTNPVGLSLEEAYAGPCVLRALEEGNPLPWTDAYLGGVVARLKKAARGDPSLLPVAKALAELRVSVRNTGGASQ
ncbi:MAG: SAM-dependent methyltransferase [Clostridiaceae bacterium]|jgi:tRNA (adenine22-N1)-methyltransferase|nr:SAM-dependent methyltransferase [Clostridiaceae bacterium]